MIISFRKKKSLNLHIHFICSIAKILFYLNINIISKKLRPIINIEWKPAIGIYNISQVPIKPRKQRQKVCNR